MLGDPLLTQEKIWDDPPVLEDAFGGLDALDSRLPTFDGDRYGCGVTDREIADVPDIATRFVQRAGAHSDETGSTSTMIVEAWTQRDGSSVDEKSPLRRLSCKADIAARLEPVMIDTSRQAMASAVGTRNIPHCTLSG